MTHIARWWRGTLAVAVLLCTLSCIDEDLSKCGKDYQIHYDVTLETSLEVELETELETVAEQELGRRLKAALQSIFTDKAHDVDLMFYGNDSLMAYEESHIIDAKEASYSIYLPMRDYQHLAMANMLLEPTVSQQGHDRAPDLKMVQQVADTVSSHSTGLFTARLPMRVKDYNQHFDVRLYMVNAAAGLVINPKTVDYKSIRCVVTHLASGFTVRDSVYHYGRSSVVRTRDLGDTGSELRCFYGVGFPSRDVPHTRAAVLSDEARDSHWEMCVYVTLPDNSITETVLHVKQPLRAGHFKLIKTEMDSDGRLVPKTSQVGATVELDWNDGGIYEPEL